MPQCSQKSARICGARLTADADVAAMLPRVPESRLTRLGHLHITSKKPEEGQRPTTGAQRDSGLGVDEYPAYAVSVHIGRVCSS